MSLYFFIGYLFPICIGLLNALIVPKILKKESLSMRVIFFATLLLFDSIFLYNTAHAKEVTCRIDFECLQNPLIIDLDLINMGWENFERPTQEQQKQKLLEAIYSHLECAKKNLKNINNLSSWVPPEHILNIRTLLTTFSAAVIPNAPQSKLVIMILGVLCEYGCETFERWDYVRTQLAELEYNLEMAEFYYSVWITL